MTRCCPRCGLRLDRGESDYFYGAYLINFAAAELIPAAVFVAMLVAMSPHPRWRLIQAVALTLAIVAPIVTYPFSKTIWLACDIALRPLKPPDFTDAQADGYVLPGAAREMGSP
jgi:hypothetical protein